MKNVKKIKILTMNIHKGFSIFKNKFVLNEIRDELQQVAPDIILLQEVVEQNTKHARKISNWPNEPQYEFLASHVWPHQAFGQCIDSPTKSHGNALLSKFEIKDATNNNISIRRIEKRGALHCKIKIPGVRLNLHVICVHLGLKEKDRLKQIKTLTNIIKNQIPSTSPLLLAGDFNDWKGSAHQILNEESGLEEAFIKSHGKAAKTFPANAPLFRLDRIYTRHVEVKKAQVLKNRPWSQLSDHLPLMIDINI